MGKRTGKGVGGDEGGSEVTHGCSVNDDRGQEGPLVLDHVGGCGSRLCGPPLHHVICQPRKLLHATDTINSNNNNVNNKIIIIIMITMLSSIWVRHVNSQYT